MRTPAPSLAQLAPFLAALCGVHVDAVREQERLLRADPTARCLGFARGRPGPGGGTPATPSNVAALLIAALSGAPRAALPKFVVDAWHAVPADSVAAALGEEAHIGGHLVWTARRP
jgi:hypothetical protein